MIKNFYFLFIFLLISNSLFAQFPSVILEDGKEYFEIGLNLEILEDPTGKLTIHDVNSPEWASKFKKSKEKYPNFGFSDSAYWARFKVINNISKIFSSGRSKVFSEI